MENENSVWLQVLLYATQCSMVWWGKSVDRACSQGPFLSYDQTKKETQLNLFLRLFSDETQKLLKELANRKPLQVPNIYHHLPHLLNNEGSLHPAVQVGLGRTGGKETYAHTANSAVMSLNSLRFFYGTCMLAFSYVNNKSNKKTPRDTHYAWEGIKSQQVISCWRVHNKYPLWTELCRRIILEYMQRWR